MPTNFDVVDDDPRKAYGRTTPLDLIAGINLSLILEVKTARH
jgi:hypothetical protein